MRYSIVKYADDKCNEMMNIWDKENESWIFDYSSPKYEICKTNLKISGKNIFKITDIKDGESYLYDAVNKCVFELGQNKIKFKKPVIIENDFSNNEFSIHKGNDNELYVVLANGRYFKLPATGHKIITCGIAGSYLYIRYDNEKKQDNKLGKRYGITISYYKLFDKNNGKELFADKFISNILEDFHFKHIFAFHDDHNTYFIKKKQIVKTYDNYVFDNTSEILNAGKDNECYILIKDTDKADHDNSVYNCIHNIIVNNKGEIIIEIDGNFLTDLLDPANDAFDGYYSSYKKNNIKYHYPKSKTYGKDFPKQWFIYHTKDDYCRIMNYNGENLLKFDDIKNVKIYISKKGDMFFVCIRDKYIYIYDENWNCLSDKWVIYSDYYISRWNNGDFDLEKHDDIETAVEFNYDKGIFTFYSAHIKENDGTPNTGKDWFEASPVFIKGKETYKSVF